MPTNEKINAQEIERERQKGDPVEIEPIPKRPDLFAWLENLFDGPGNWPESIDIYQVRGRNSDQRCQTPIKQYPFLPKTNKKPSREELVNYCNRFLHDVQNDCDTLGKPSPYGIFAKHFTRDSDYYQWFRVRATPKTIRKDLEDDDDDSSPQAKYHTQKLAHDAQMHALYSQSYEGIMDRFDRVLERQENHIERLQARIEKQNEMMERALSLEYEREKDRKWQDLQIKGIEMAAQHVLPMLGPTVNAFASKKLIPTDDTPISVTLRNLLKRDEEGGTLTGDQAIALLGAFDKDPPHKMIKAGILTPEQGGLLFGLADGSIPPDRLGRLIPPEGDMAITNEQLVKIQQVLKVEQLLPLKMLFDTYTYQKHNGGSNANGRAST